MTTTSEFYSTELLYKRYGSRSITYITGVTTLFPNFSKILIINLLITIGLPGTSLFICKFLFLAILFKINIFITLILGTLFIIIIPVFFMRIWVVMINGQQIFTKQLTVDLYLKDYILLITPIIFSTIIGIAPTLIT